MKTLKRIAASLLIAITTLLLLQACSTYTCPTYASQKSTSQQRY